MSYVCAVCLGPAREVVGGHYVHDGAGPVLGTRIREVKPVEAEVIPIRRTTERKEPGPKLRAVRTLRARRRQL